MAWPQARPLGEARGGEAVCAQIAENEIFFRYRHRCRLALPNVFPTANRLFAASAATTSDWGARLFRGEEHRQHRREIMYSISSIFSSGRSSLKRRHEEAVHVAVARAMAAMGERADKRRLVAQKLWAASRSTWLSVDGALYITMLGAKWWQQRKYYSAQAMCAWQSISTASKRKREISCNIDSICRVYCQYNHLGKR